MLTCFQQINSVEDLRDYVNTTICNQYQLQTGAFPMTERILRRHDKPCGIYFCLHGPRAPNSRPFGKRIETRSSSMVPGEKGFKRHS